MSNYTYTLLYDYILKIITDYFTVKNFEISGFLKGSSNGDFLSSDKQYRSEIILLIVFITGRLLQSKASRYKLYNSSSDNDRIFSVFNIAYHS